MLLACCFYTVSKLLRMLSDLSRALVSPGFDNEAPGSSEAPSGRHRGRVYCQATASVAVPFRYSQESLEAYPCPSARGETRSLRHGLAVRRDDWSRRHHLLCLQGVQCVVGQLLLVAIFGGQPGHGVR